jgi:hypothetical protein
MRSRCSIALCNRLINHYADLAPLEPIREVLESDESDVIHCSALGSLESARCGSLNTALRRTGVAFVTRAI